MPENNDNLQFLVCNQCNGLGYVGGKKCSQCQGKGIVAYLAGYILYWGKKINSQYLRLDGLEDIIYKITIAFLLVLAFLGLASLVLSFYLVNFNLRIILNLNFWQSANNYHLFFWLTILTDLYLVYLFSLAKDKKEKVIVKKYKPEEGTEIIAPPPIDWQQVKNFNHKYQIDIAKAFNAEALKVVKRSFLVAEKYKALEVGPVHFLIGALLISQEVENIFVRLGVDLNNLAGKIGRVAAKYPQTEGATVFSGNSVRILLKAYNLAYLNKQSEVDVTEILQAAVKEDKMIQEVLFDLNITLDKLNNVILWFRIRKLLQKQWQLYRAGARLKSKTGIDRAMTAIQTPYLNKFAEDLTLLAKMGHLDLCIDREKEFSEIFRVLEASSIKGIVLVGEPGVGKTSIIEGLAQKMIADDVPEFLRDKRFVSLSIPHLVSGASASEAQERLLISLNEIIAAGNVILYIDNIHDIMGISAGGSEAPDLSDLLVEVLSKNLIILLSSTNPLNYARSLENSALGNIIKKIDIPEPDLNQTIQVLEGKVGFIEGKNNVYFSYDALEQAAKLTDRYVHDLFLPYKAITLLEEVAVWAKQNKGARAIITGNDVATLVSEKIKMPVSEVSEAESKKLLNLEAIIHKRIVDQEEAVAAVSASLRRARAELRDVDRPIANLLFLGPTGVGKTELAKTLAAVYFGNEENMIRLDMSEYQEPDSIKRLIGAPPAGPGLLTEAVRQKPFAILLLDELEKAHPDILNVFLQVMEDGRLTDASGRTVDFTNIILIATSNAQTDFIQQKVAAGVPIEDIKKQLLETELKQYFKPEFLNRFDNIIVFKPLAFEDVVKITHLMLKDVAKNLEAKGINFQATEEAVKELAEIGFDPQYGARPLRRAIQERVDNALADYLLQGKIGRRDLAVLEKGGKIRIEKAKQL